MGVRTEKWPAARLAQMAAFFSAVGYKHTDEWKEEIVFFDRGKAVPSLLTFPDGTPARLQPDQDPREAFADWLLAPGNPWFARSIVNRVWYWLQIGVCCPSRTGRRRGSSRIRIRGKRSPIGCSLRAIRGSRAQSSTASGIGYWAAGSSRSRTTFAPTIRPKTRSCWLGWGASWWLRIMTCGMFSG